MASCGSAWAGGRAEAIWRLMLTTQDNQKRSVIMVVCGWRFLGDGKFMIGVKGGLYKALLANK